MSHWILFLSTISWSLEKRAGQFPCSSRSVHMKTVLMATPNFVLSSLESCPASAFMGGFPLSQVIHPLAAAFGGSQHLPHQLLLVNLPPSPLKTTVFSLQDPHVNQARHQTSLPPQF